MVAGTEKANVNVEGSPALGAVAGGVITSVGAPATLTVTVPVAVPVAVPAAGGVLPPVLEPACAPTAAVTVAAVDVLRIAVAAPC